MVFWGSYVLNSRAGYRVWPYVLVCLTLIGWYISSIALTTSNKILLDSLAFPYSLAMTFFHFTVVSLCLRLLLYWKSYWKYRLSLPDSLPLSASHSSVDVTVPELSGELSGELCGELSGELPRMQGPKISPPLIPKGQYFRTILPIAASSAIEIGLSNVAVTMVSISVITVVKSCLIAFIYVFSILAGIEKFQWKFIAVIAWITLSVGMSVQGMEINDPLGLVLLVVATLSAAFRWVLINKQLANNSDDDMEKASDGIPEGCGLPDGGAALGRAALGGGAFGGGTLGGGSSGSEEAQPDGGLLERHSAERPPEKLSLSQNAPAPATGTATGTATGIFSEASDTTHEDRGLEASSPSGGPSGASGPSYFRDVSEQEVSLTPIELICVVQPLAAMCLFPFALTLDVPGIVATMTVEPADPPRSTLIVVLLMYSVVLVFLLLYFEFKLVNLTSSLTLSVAGVGKECCTIGTSILLFKEVMPWRAVCGTASSIVGITAYVWLRSRKTTA